MLRPHMNSVKCAVIGSLVAVNFLMAMYTLPLLLSDDYPDGDSVGLQQDKREDGGQNKYSNFRRLPPSDNILNGDTAAFADRREMELQNTFEDYSFNYLYIHQASLPCKPDTFLLIVVCSAVQHFDLRDAIRNTWGRVALSSKRRLGTKIVYMLGAPTAEYQHLQTQVAKEAETHGDIIQESFVDSYKNLTLKTIGALKWAVDFCAGVQFFMKTDDDVFINVPNLVQLLMDMAQGKHARYVLGHVIDGAKPIADRNSKWYTPTSLFKRNTYPRYVSGSAYVFSGNIIEDVYYSATTRKPFWLEDIYITGMLAAQAQAALIHSDKFTISKSRLTHPCFYKVMITGHELTATDLHNLWRSLHRNDLECSLYISQYAKGRQR